MRNYKKIVLKNGLRLLLVPQASSLAATVLILVKAGSEYETKKINGLSHFLEHMTFKGTVNRPRPGTIAEELAALGAQSNAFTGQEYTGYWAKAEAHKLPKILDIVSDLYLNPIFNPEEIEKERGVVIEEINMYEDTPMRRVQEVLMSLLYGDQPAGWDIAGSKANILRLQKSDFLKYRAARYVPQNTVVIVAGKFSAKPIIAQVKEAFSAAKRKPSYGKPKTKESQSRSRVRVKFKESDQSHLVIGVRAFTMFDKRRYALSVLADVLGGGMSSRLFKKVREELGAAYYVNASPDLFLDHGYLGIASGVDHKKIEIVLKAILDELKRLRDEIVPAKELQKSKDHMLGSMILGLETSDELAGFYGMEEVLSGKIEEPEEFMKKIRAVTAEEIREVARALFADRNLNLAVIGPYKTPASRNFERLLTL